MTSSSLVPVFVVVVLLYCCPLFMFFSNSLAYVIIKVMELFQYHVWVKSGSSRGQVKVKSGSSQGQVRVKSGSSQGQVKIKSGSSQG